MCICEGFSCCAKVALSTKGMVLPASRPWVVSTRGPTFLGKGWSVDTGCGAEALPSCKFRHSGAVIQQ